MNARCSALITALVAASGLYVANGQTSFKFDFGTGKPVRGYTKVTPTTMYTGELGYGLEPGSTVQAVERKGNNPLYDDFLTSDQPFYFSVRVPEEGNYRVTGEPR